ncbi:MAG: RNA-guided endonuclease IscB [Myxococcota bacterium]
MFVYVLNRHTKPLMPCSPGKARKLLQQGKAKVVSRTPFTIQLLFGSSGYKQPIRAGMDTGSKKLGSAAVANGKVVYQAEVQLRQDISKKMQQRKTYRRGRRYRLRYRPARWRNRASMRRQGRLSPSVQSKLDSHLREKRQMEALLPIREWVVEVANFDIHKLQNPEVQGVGYHQGPQQGFANVRAYVLARDGYRCTSGRKVKHDPVLHVHHVVYRSQGGSDAPDNLRTLCKRCHEDLHQGLFTLPNRRRSRKHPTHMGILQAMLQDCGWLFAVTFGYLTQAKRQTLGWPKSHVHDAVAICLREGEWVEPSEHVLSKRHVAAGDDQQRKGRNSQQVIPTGKLFGLRKFDWIETPQGDGFVKGKRNSGYFSLMDIHGQTVHASAKVKDTSIRRVSARKSTRVQRTPTPKKEGDSSQL